MASYRCAELFRNLTSGIPHRMHAAGSIGYRSANLKQTYFRRAAAGLRQLNGKEICGMGPLQFGTVIKRSEAALAGIEGSGKTGGNSSTDKGSNSKSPLNYGMIMVASSPLLFSTYEDEPTGMSELLFLAGKSIGMCVERIFENEVGNSVFIGLLLLSYIAILGKEGSLYGFVYRLKYRYATNFKAVTHPKYSYAIPPNPLLKRK